jgi:hypothetical protein
MVEHRSPGIKTKAGTGMVAGKSTKKAEKIYQMNQSSYAIIKHQHHQDNQSYNTIVAIQKDGIINEKINGKFK